MTGVSVVPEGLQVRGSRLWLALGQAVGTPAGELALEACRTADRLDELDSVIAGKGVLNLMAFRCSFDEDLEDGGRELHIKVEFANVLAEARQQGAAFKALLEKLGFEVSPAGAGDGGEESPLAQVLALARANNPGGSAKRKK